MAKHFVRFINFQNAVYIWNEFFRKFFVDYSNFLFCYIVKVENLVKINVYQNITIKSYSLVWVWTFKVGQNLMIVFFINSWTINWSIVDTKIVVAEESRQTPLTTWTNMVEDRTNVFVLEDSEDATDTSISQVRQREVDERISVISWLDYLLKALRRL